MLVIVTVVVRLGPTVGSSSIKLPPTRRGNNVRKSLPRGPSTLRAQHFSASIDCESSVSPRHVVRWNEGWKLEGSKIFICVTTLSTSRLIK